MSDSNGKAKASLYSLDISEISMTDESQGFAASGMETILVKNRLTCKEDLTPEQTALLEKYGEEFTPLQKQKGDTNSLSSVKSDAGEDNLTKGNEMSDKEKDDLQKALDTIAALTKQIEDNQTEQLTKSLTESLSKYEFSEVEGITKALQSVEVTEREAIIKAFDELHANKDEIQKAAKKEAGFTEEGIDGEAEIDKASAKPLTLVEKLAELNKDQENK